MEVLRQNYNHPSIITWTPFNESWGIPQVETERRQQHYTEAIYHLTKAFDPMRPVISNDGWEHTVSDIITLHDYEEDGERFLNRYLTHKEEILRTQLYHCGHKSAMANGFSYEGQPVILSEYGGIAFADKQQGEWGYGNAVKSEEEFLCHLSGSLYRRILLHAGERCGAGGERSDAGKQNLQGRPAKNQTDHSSRRILKDAPSLSSGNHLPVFFFFCLDKSLHRFGVRKIIGAVVASDHHGSFCRTEL